MSLDLLRTVQHDHGDGSFNVTVIKKMIIEREDGAEYLTIDNETGDVGSIIISNRKHLNDLIVALKSAADAFTTLEWEEAE